MATNIPPHNLGEVIAACIALIDNPSDRSTDLIAIVPGPDFPTGGMISAAPASFRPMRPAVARS
jgi:DNA gyrase subunit A